MAEYVVDCDVVPHPKDPEASLVLPISVNGHVHERLIRCKDCEYGFAIEAIGCLAFGHADERLQPKDPDGFCKWAVPRAGDG